MRVVLYGLGIRVVLVMQRGRRKGGKRRRQGAEGEEDERPTKRGKEEADEDKEDDEEGDYGATDPQAGEPWTAEEDRRVRAACRLCRRLDL